MKRGIMVMTLAVFIFLTAVYGFSIWASNLDTLDALECGAGTVLKGESKTTVRQMCGEPDEVYGENVDETWVYNFGPTRYIYYITFTGELVSLIQSGDYGS